MIQDIHINYIQYCSNSLVDGNGEISLNEGTLDYDDDSESDDSTEYHSSRSSGFGTIVVV